MTYTLDKRDEDNGLDFKIVPEMLNRTEVLPGVSAQELINAICDLLDGTPDHHINDMIGDEDMAKRLGEIRGLAQPHWTYNTGGKVMPNA